jgi:putative lipoprotein (rSAM/lipoprotein system)
MTNMIIRSIQRVLLAALAFASGATVSGCMYGPSPAMYGPPPAYGPSPAALEIKGKVTQRDGTPIPDIRISVKDATPDEQWEDAVSDANGEYIFLAYPYAGGEEVTVTATDEDGAANGGDFASASDTIEVPGISTGEKSSFDVNLMMDPKP